MRDVPKLRVLIVDDEEKVRRGLEVWLTQRQFTVVAAGGLRSAQQAAIDFEPDVILLDVKLGPEDGLRLVPLIRKAGLEIPFVVLTAHAGPYDGFQAHELGAVNLIEKPSSPDQIATVLRAAVKAPPRFGFGLPHRRSRKMGARSSVHVVEATRLIRENFAAKGLSLERLARLVEVSPGHLGRTFRQEEGCSVVAYIHERRVEHAAYLLQNSERSIKVIADDCGYHGSSELYRHFLQRYGQSPGRFRHRAKQADRRFRQVSSE